jgi:alkylation response protein AidB-like acyl-CoA dehydrogenase
MSSSETMIETTVDRLLARSDLAMGYAALQDGEFPAQIWSDVAEASLPLLLCSEDAGGVGAGFDDAVELARLSGAGGMPVPMVETLIGNWLLGLAEVEPGAGPVAVLIDVSTPVPHVDQLSHPSVIWRAIPWARHSRLLAIAKGGHGLRVGLVPDGTKVVTAHGKNLAGEPRDTVDLSGFDAISIAWRDLPAEIDPSAILARMALLRAASMVGAMDRALRMSLAYTSDRNQFGRSLASFQVIQHTLAVMATQVAAAKSAVMMAAVQSEPKRVAFLAAVAKARAGDAAGVVAAAAHQVHGAMGFTQEYGLGISTKRLWSWRSEDGSEAYWQEWLGARAREAGDMWAVIAA